MKKLIEFLDKWINFEIYETDEGGIYQIYAGVSKEGVSADLSTHGFNLYFGNSKSVVEGYHEYGFNSADSFKKGTILSLYYISRISAQEIVGQHIINAVRKGNAVTDMNVNRYIWEGKSQGCPEKCSIYIDLRDLE